MKKRFKLFSFILGIMSLLVTAFVLWAVPAQADTYFGDGTATSSPSVTVTLEIYDAEEYEKYNAYWGKYDADMAQISMFVGTPNEALMLSMFKTTNDNTTSLADYYARPYGMEASEASLTTVAQFAAYKESHKYSALTTVKKDQEIVVAAYMKENGGTGLIQNAGVVLGDMNGQLTVVSPGSYVNSNFDSTYPASTSADANVSTVTNGRKIGGAMSGLTSGLDATSKLFLGALTYKVNTSGTLTLDLPLDSGTEFTDTGGGNANIKTGGSSFTFKASDHTFTVKSDKSEDPSLANISVTIGSTTTNLTPSATTDNYATPIAVAMTSGKPSATDTTATVTVHFTDVATVTSMTYGSSSTGTGSTATGGAVTLGDPGTSTYVRIETLAEDNTHTAVYILEIPKEKYKVAELTSIGTVAASGGTAGTTTLSPDPFNKGTFAYDITIPKDATSLSLNPTFDDVAVASGGKAMTAKVKAPGSSTYTNYTSGSGLNFTSGLTNGSKFYVKVFAQDTNVSQEYTFTIKHAEVDTSLTVSVDNLAVSPNKNYPGGYDALGTTWSLTKMVEPTVASVTLKLTNSKNATIVARINGATQSNPASIPINFTGTGADTVTVDVTVTAEAGGTPKAYTIVIERRAANTHNELDTATTQVLADDGTTISGSWSGSTFTTTTDIDFTKNGFKVVPVLSNDCKEDGSFVATMKYRTSGAVGTGTSIISGGTTAVNSFSGYAQTTKTIYIDVTAEDSTVAIKTYEINVTRAKADEDSTLKPDSSGDPEIEVRDSKNNIVNYTYNSTDKTFTTTSKLDAAIKSVTLNLANPNVDTSKVYVSTDQTSWSLFSGSFTRNLTLSNVDKSTNFYIKVVAQNPTKETIYKVVTESKAQQDTTNFTAVVTGLGNNQAYTGTDATADPTDHIYYIPQNPGGTSFRLNITLDTDSDRAKIYYSVNTNNPTTLLADGAGITNSIGAYGSPTKVYVKIVSEHGADNAVAPYVVTHTYEIQHTDTRDDNSKISDIVVEGKDYEGNVVSFATDYTFVQTDTTTKTINVPYEVTQLRFIVTLEKDTSKLKYNGTTSYKSPDTGTSVVNIPLFNTPNSQTFTFQGRAENETFNENIYQIKIERETPETGNSLVSLKYNSALVTGYTPGSNFAYNIGLNTNTVTVDLEVSPKAVFTYSYDTVVEDTDSFSMINQFTNGTYKKVTINVKSQKQKVDGGTGNTYTIYMISADDSVLIDNINIYESSVARPLLEDVNGNNFTYVAGTSNYQTPAFNIAYAKGNPEFEVELNDYHPDVVVTGDGPQTQPVGSKTHNIIVKSQYNAILDTLGLSSLAVTSQTVTYKIGMKREAASTANTLDWLKITINGTVYNIDLTKNDVIENVGNVGSIIVEYEKTDKLSTITSPVPSVTGDKSGTKTKSFSLDINLDATNPSYPFVITVHPEDSTVSDTSYKVGIFAGAAVQSSNVDITNIKIHGDKTSTNIMTGTNAYNKAKDSYNPTINGTNQYAYVTVILAEPTKQTLKINGVVHDPANDKEIELGTYGDVTQVTVQCFAEDNTPGTVYTIDITRDNLDTDNKLKSFKIETYKEDGTIVSSQVVTGFNPTDVGGVYTVNVTNDIAKIKLVPALNSTKATLVSNTASSETAINVGANGPFSVSVKAENEDTELYLVNVIRDDVTTLSDLILTDQNGDPIPATAYTFDTTLNPQNYNITVKYPVEKVNVEAVPDGDRANLTITGEGNHSLNVGTNPTIKVVVSAKSNASSTYTLNITRADGVADNKIVSYINQEGIDKTSSASASKIEYNLPRNTTSWAPTIEYPDGSTNNFDSIDKTLVPGLNTKNLVITSETGVPRSYEINVYCTETTKDLDSINLLDAAGGTSIKDVNDNTKAIGLSPLVMDLTIAYGDTATLYGYLEATLNHNSPHAKVYIDGVEASNKTVQINVGLNTYNVAVLSEDDIAHGLTYADVTSAYNVNVTRNPANSDAHLEELHLIVGGVEKTLTPVFAETHNGGVYVVENIGDTVTALTITAKAIESTTKINGGSYLVSNTPGTYSRVLSLESLVSAEEGYTKDFDIVTVAEDGQTTYTYTITVSRGPLNLNADHSVQYLTLEDSEGVEYINDNYRWDTNNYKAKATIPFSAQAITFTVGKTIVSPSVVHFTKAGSEINNPNNKVSYTDKITSDMRGTTVTYTVYVEAQDKSGTSDIYTIEVKFEDASKDRFLSALYADDVLVTGFDPDDHSQNSYSYTLSMRDNSIETINIKAILSDTKASLSGSDLGDQDLEVGDNRFTVVVTAENGDSTKYFINVRRDEKAPYITDLEIEGKPLLDLNNKATEFTNDVKTYHGKVTYFDMTATLKVTIDNSSYTVTCSNATLSSSTKTLKTFETSALAVGQNEFVITVTSPVFGRKTTYTLIIIKSDQQSANTAMTNIIAKKVDEAKKETQLTSDEFAFNDEKQLYTGIVVDNDVKDIIFEVTLENAPSETSEGATIKYYNNKDLRVGLNTIFLVVTAEDGVTKRIVEVEVTRLEPAYEIGISEISDYKDDYKNDTLKDSYTVASNVNQLTFDVKATSTTADDFTYTVVNGTNLVVGENTVTVEITSADGKKETKEIKVIRENMKYTVDKAAYEYTCSEASNAAQINTSTDFYYTIDLVDKKADAISDYAKYITDMSDGVTAKVISNPDSSASEVIVKVANADETEVNYIHFQINTTANRGSLFDWFFWIILLLAIILLIIILICVNRDKYGSVSKKRKAQ